MAKQLLDDKYNERLQLEEPTPVSITGTVKRYPFGMGLPEPTKICGVSFYLAGLRFTQLHLID